MGRFYLTTIEHTCIVCKSHTTLMKRCTRCKVRWFCSRKCQLLDWKTHRHQCKLREDFLKSPKKIKIIHNKKYFTVTLCREMSGIRIMQEIANQLRINFLTVICRGSILNKDNCHHYIFKMNTKKFMAFGVQHECEIGLSSEDVSLIADQTKVQRNLAVKALRECKGNLLDALKVCKSFTMN